MEKDDRKYNLRDVLYSIIWAVMCSVEISTCTRYGTVLVFMMFVLLLMSVSFWGFLNDFLGGGGGRYSCKFFC